MVAALIAALFCITPWGQQLDHIAYDSYFNLRGPQPLRDDILFVAIDETSFQEVGLQWPWPRSLHARLLRNLYTAGARTVAMDILFAEPSTAEEDQRLAQALTEFGPTILAVDVSQTEDNRFAVENIVQPLPILQTPRTILGHIRNPTDTDGFVRRVDLELRDYRSLGHEAAVQFSRGTCCQNLPTEPLPLVNFSGGPDTVQTISYYQALDPDRYLPPSAVTDKLVIVGINTQNNAEPDERRPDHFPTPFSRWGGGYSPGSLVHANVAANLLQERFMQRTPMLATALVGLLLALLYGLTTLKLSFSNSSLIGGGLIVLIFAGSFWAFSQQLLYISPLALFAPLLAVYLLSPYYRFREEARQRAYIREAFSTYVNPSIVAQLEKDPSSAKLGGKQIDGTALFLDIAGFTSLSERHAPETVVGFVNEFFSGLISIAMEAEGTVERFLGDAFMVIWGAPTEQPDHAQRACTAAIAMAAEIQRISDTESDRLGARVHARIGINSGSMTAGNIGAAKRFNYTVLGDCVNLSARLEGLNKIYGTTLIIGNTTADQLDDTIVLRELDLVTVKGRETPERIFEILGLRGQVAERKLAAARHYADGLSLYRQGHFSQASEAFQTGLQADPADGPCQVLAGRCKEYAKTAPTADWSGVMDITVK